MRQIFFFHIPKTGGSSIKQQIQPQFCQNKICPYFHQAQIKGNEKWSTWDLFWGHFSLNLRDRLDNPAVFTFLRDPVERFLSEYHYVRSFRDEIEEQGCVTWAHGLIEPYSRMNLEQICEDEKFVLQRLNLQTLWLAGYLGHEKELCEASWKDLRLTALLNLKSMEFVGLTDNFEASIRALGAKYQWKLPDTSPKIKAHPAKPLKGWSSQLSKNFLVRLRTFAAYDYELVQKRTTMTYFDKSL